MRCLGLMGDYPWVDSCLAPRPANREIRDRSPKFHPKLAPGLRIPLSPGAQGFPQPRKSYKKLKRSGDALFSGVLWGFPPCFMRRIQKKYLRGTARPARGTPGRLSDFFKNVYIFTKGIPPGLSEIQTPRQPIFDQLSHGTRNARAFVRAALCVV